MTYVEIKKISGSGPAAIYKVWLDPATSEVKSDLPEAIWSYLSKGIPDHLLSDDDDESEFALTYPKDGEKFLENLRFNLSSGYYRASSVIRGDSEVIA